MKQVTSCCAYLWNQLRCQLSGLSCPNVRSFAARHVKCLFARQGRLNTQTSTQSVKASLQSEKNIGVRRAAKPCPNPDKTHTLPSTIPIARSASKPLFWIYTFHWRILAVQKNFKGFYIYKERLKGFRSTSTLHYIVWSFCDKNSHRVYNAINLYFDYIGDCIRQLRRDRPDSIDLVR